MARARNIKPSFFTNDDLAETGPFAMLLFQALWCLADREGRLEDRPKRIKIEALPYFDVDVDELLTVLASAGFITRYAHEEHRYIQVKNFTKHQNPSVKEAKSTIPAPNEHGASTVPERDENDANSADIRITDIPHTDIDAANADVPTAQSEKPTAKRKHRLPDDFTVDDELTSYGEKLGFCRSEIEAETEKFRLHHRAKGTLMLEWRPAWKGWMRRALEYRSNLSPPPVPPPDLDATRRRKLDRLRRGEFEGYTEKQTYLGFDGDAKLAAAIADLESQLTHQGAPL